MTAAEWTSEDIHSLVERGLCPSYLLPSTSRNGLCLPNLVLARSAEQAENITINMEQIHVSDVQMLNPDKVLNGSWYARANSNMKMRGV